MIYAGRSSEFKMGGEELREPLRETFSAKRPNETIFWMSVEEWVALRLHYQDLVVVVKNT